MRLELPKEVERFGAVQFGSLQKVFELDSGMREQPAANGNSTIRQIPQKNLYNIQKQMAIVVPIRQERLKLVEGVLCGIPHPCLVIIVSNSPRDPIDRFHMEEDALKDLCVFTNKNALIVHQKDPALAKAFKKVGYKEILNEKGEIHNGKAEGMIIGTLMAMLAKKKYIGFVDGDNYFPGAVEEYVREYAAGFHIADSKYSMVRIAWHSKPKIVQSKFFFRKWGRTSQNTNQLLNRLISHYTGYETEIIKTGNAGEHAMTIELAKILDYSERYSIEPYHIINLIEKFGGLSKSPFPDVMKKNIYVYQIESRNPHLHEAGDEDHIEGMSFDAMRCIYHSPICPDRLKDNLLKEMSRKKLLSDSKKPPQLRVYPALANINLKSFLTHLGSAPYAKLIRKGNL